MSGKGSAWDSLAGFGKGVGKGLYEGGRSAVEGVVDLAKGGYDLATDPATREQAWQAANELAKRAKDYAEEAYGDPAKVYQDARDGAARLYSAFDEARRAAEARGESAEFWGNAVGRGGFEAASLLVPAGAAAKAGKLGTAAKAAKAADAIDDAADMAKVGNRVKAAGVGKAAPDAPVCVKGCPRAGTAGGAASATAKIVAQRKSLARKFYEDQGWEPGRVDSHLKGIDFTKDVEIVELPAGTELTQWQVPGGPKGNYFAPATETPSRLGISPVGDALAPYSGAVSKVQSTFKSDRTIKALRSTAAAVQDTWSSRHATAETIGGATQYFVPLKDAFK